MFPNTNDLASQAKFDNVIEDYITLVIAWISTPFKKFTSKKLRSLPQSNAKSWSVIFTNDSFSLVKKIIESCKTSQTYLINSFILINQINFAILLMI